MTEAKANIILKYLFKRVENDPQAESISKVLFINRVAMLSNLCIHFESWRYYEGSTKPNVFEIQADILASNGSNIYSTEYVYMKKPMTSSNIVECLFKYAEDKDIYIGMRFINFIYKGETPEEILVKADLEDFN